MATLLAVSAQLNNRINDLTAQLYRVEVNLKRGELRAARAQLRNLRDEIESFTTELRAPAEFMIIGANVGLFSGGKLRGRLSGALFGAFAGWLYGQSTLRGPRQLAAELAEYADELERRANAPAPSPSEG